MQRRRSDGVVILMALLVATALGVVARGEAELEQEDGSATVHMLLQLHESTQRDASYDEHVDTLVSGLRAQAMAADGADVASAADIADSAIADEAVAEAEGEPLRVFGEAAAEAVPTATAEATDATFDGQTWSAGPALLETAGDAADAADVAAAADVADAAIADEVMADAAASETPVQVFGEAPSPVATTTTAEAVVIDTEEWSAGSAFVEADAEADEEVVEEEGEGEATEIVEALPTAESQVETQWNAGPALLQTEDEFEDEDEADAEDEDEAEAEDEEETESDEEADDEEEIDAEDEVEDEDEEEVDAEDEVDEDEEADSEDEAEDETEEEEEVSLLQVKGDWKDPPVWWKAPEEEMANADQQPWPLDPNFPMSVLDPPPNLPLANIEDANNYPPMADPNMSFNLDPSAFPQTNDKVGADDPSFASFSINGR